MFQGMIAEPVLAAGRAEHSRAALLEDTLLLLLLELETS